jgi:hypothetical protein
MKTTHTKNKVIDYLQWTTIDYNNLQFQTLWNWCQEHGKYPSMIQQLLINRQINYWFLTEFEKRELKFIKAVEASNFSVVEMQMIYKATTSLLISIYPIALMEGISRNRDFTMKHQEFIYFFN